MRVCCLKWHWVHRCVLFLKAKGKKNQQAFLLRRKWCIMFMGFLCCIPILALLGFLSSQVSERVDRQSGKFTWCWGCLIWHLICFCEMISARQVGNRKTLQARIVRPPKSHRRISEGYHAVGYNSRGAVSMPHVCLATSYYISLNDTHPYHQDELRRYTRRSHAVFNLKAQVSFWLAFCNSTSANYTFDY